MRSIRVMLVLGLAGLPRAAAAQAGTPTGFEFRVNAYTPSFQKGAAVAADPSGNFVVSWWSYLQDGSSSGVFAQRYAGTGEPLGPQFRVNTYTSGGQDGPAVSADGAGNFVVVWTSSSQEGSGFGVFGQRFASTGLPLGPEFRVNTYTTDHQSGPVVASDASGNFVVVWGSYLQDGSSHGLFGQRFSASGVPSGPEFRVNTYTTGMQINHAISSDAAGNFVVVWMRDIQSLPNAGIFGQRYASTGTPIGGEFRINSYTTSFNIFPDVASDASGGFVVVWSEFPQDGDSYGIVGQRFASNGAALGGEFRVNTYTTGDQHIADVAMEPSGNFVVVWMSRDQDGADWGIFSQRYSSTGAPEGPEFRVNSYTTDTQHEAHVAASGSGSFVVVWESNTQDGSEDGVFAQRYKGIVPVELMHFGIE